MSKERAKRRTAREREAAIRSAARAAEEERRERREARKKALRRITTGQLPARMTTGRQTGVLARRRRTRTALLVAFLLAVNILVWVVRPDWPARLAALVVSILVAPLLAGLLFRRR